MECDETRPRLELYVLQGLAPFERARVKDHLRGCAECRRVVADYRALVGEMRSASARVLPGPALAASVRSAAAVELRATRRRVWLRNASLVAGGVAAVLLIGIVLSDPGSRTSGRRAAGTPEKWRYGGAPAVPASLADAVVVRGSSIYSLRGCEGGLCVVAVDAVTGRERWQAERPCQGYLAADRDRVFCLAAAGPARLELVALGVDTGAELWRKTVQARGSLLAPTPPVPLGDDRVCWTSRSTLCVMDAASGRVLWERTLGGGGGVSAAAAGDKLYAATSEALHCLDLASGRDLWTESLAAAVAGRGRPLIDLADGRAYLALPRRGGRGTLVCMDLATRSMLWQAMAPDVRHLLATPGAVVLRGQDVRAHDGRTGRTLWARPAEGCGPLTRDAGLVYCVDSGGNGRLLALEPATGRSAWEIAGIRSCDAFRRVGRTGYVKTHDGVIHAIALRRP